jgi:hypothetical protein
MEMRWCLTCCFFVFLFVMSVESSIFMTKYLEPASTGDALESRLLQKNVFPTLFVLLSREESFWNQFDVADDIFQPIQYVTGPFVSHYRVMEKKTMNSWLEEHRMTLNCYNGHMENSLTLLVFDDPFNARTCTQFSSPALLTDPLHIKDLFSQRYAIPVKFSLSKEYENRNLELKWVHFRGNFQIVSLNDSNSPLFFSPPKQEIIQYTRAGHVFAITDAMKKLPNSSNITKFDQFMKFHEIVGLYIVPPVHFSSSESNEFYPIIVSPKNNKLINVSTIAEYQFLGAKEEQLEKEQSEENEFEYFKRTLLAYWKYQRKSQIGFLQRHLPGIPFRKDNFDDLARTISGKRYGNTVPPMIKTQFSGLYRKNIYKKIFLPPWLKEGLSQEHFKQKYILNTSQEEPFISMVFNQYQSPTYYVPLQNQTLLRELEQFVLRETCSWLDVSCDDLEVTSAYGFREYRKDAIIRWHVDPIETQPITAIVHIADSLHCDSVANHPANFHFCPSWPLHTIKSEQYQLDFHEFDEINLKEGEAVLIQSGKFPHSRLTPLPIDFYANAFVHLAPKNWRNNETVRKLMEN